MFLYNPLMVDPRVHKEAKALINPGKEVTVIILDRKNEYDPKSNIDGAEIAMSIKKCFLNRYCKK